MPRADAATLGAPTRTPTVLTIGGTDPLGGAGVHADAMHLAALHCHATVAITALVDQDSHGVHGVSPTDPAAFQTSLRRTLVDAPPAAVKIGMVASPAHAEVIATMLAAHASRVPVVLDPVLAGGTSSTPSLHVASVSQAEMAHAVWTLAHAVGALVTPNLSEARALLVGVAPAAASSEGSPVRLAALWRASSPLSALVKGGHAEDVGVDHWVSAGEEQPLAAFAWPYADVHGTGCALASAIAARRAVGDPPLEAVRSARRWLAERVARYTATLGSGRRQFVALPSAR